VRLDAERRPVRGDPQRTDAGQVEHRARQRPRVAGPDLDLARVSREQRADLGHLALREHTAAVQQQHVVRQLFDLVQHVARDEDRRAVASELEHELDDAAPRDRIETRERLVGNEQLRRMRDRLRDLGPLAHAARVAARGPKHRVGEPHAFERLRGAIARLSCRMPRKAQQESHEVAPGHVVVERVLLRYEARLREVRAVRERIAAEDFDRAARRPDLTRDELQERRLARAIGTQETNDARFELERDVDEPDHGSIPAREIPSASSAVMRRLPTCGHAR
jgi:hypothetical protein